MSQRPPYHPPARRPVSVSVLDYARPMPPGPRKEQSRWRGVEVLAGLLFPYGYAMLAAAILQVVRSSDKAWTLALLLAFVGFVASLIAIPMRLGSGAFAAGAIMGILLAALFLMAVCGLA